MRVDPRIDGLDKPTPSMLGKGANMKGRKMSRRKSKKSFRKGAMKTHRKNVAPRPMRGGYRL